MQNRFDELTKVVAQGGSRRQMLRLVGAGLVGGVLATLGISTASAQTAPPPTAECNQCIAQFRGSCIATCVQQFPGQQSLCAQACCEGAVTTCLEIGQCVPPVDMHCPQT